MRNTKVGSRDKTRERELKWQRSFFFFPWCFIFIYNSVGYDRAECLYVFDEAWLIASYLSISLLSRHLYFTTFEIFSRFGSELWLYSTSNFLPIWSSLCSYSSSFSFYFLLPTMINFKYSNEKLIIFLFASNSTSFSSSFHFYQLISSLNRLPISFCFSFLYRRDLVYKYLTICFLWLYHQYWGVSTILILAR